MQKNKFFVPETELQEQNEYKKKVKNIVKSRFQGETPKAFVHTYGCQGNVADSEHIKGQLVEMGYSMTEELESANTQKTECLVMSEH